MTAHAGVHAGPSTWQLDPSHSSVELSVKQMMAQLIERE